MSLCIKSNAKITAIFNQQIKISLGIFSSSLSVVCLRMLLSEMARGKKKHRTKRSRIQTMTQGKVGVYGFLRGRKGLGIVVTAFWNLNGSYLGWSVLL